MSVAERGGRVVAAKPWTPWHPGRRRPTSILLALVVMSSVLFLPLMAAGGASGSPDAGSSFALIYPLRENSGFDNAHNLVSQLSGDLGLGSLTPEVNNSVSILDVPLSAEGQRYGNSSNPFPGYYYPSLHWWERSENGSLVGALYSPSGGLVEVRGVVTGGDRALWTTQNGSDHEAVARRLATSLGVSSDLVPNALTVEESLHHDESGNIERREVGVTLWGNLSGLSVEGANRLYVHFTNSEVATFSLYPFYSTDLQLVPDTPMALEAVRSLAASLYGQEMRFGEHPQVLSMAWDQESGSIAQLVRCMVSFQHDGAEVVETLFVLVDAHTGEASSYVRYVGVTAGNIDHPGAVVTTDVGTFPLWEVASVIAVAVLGAALLLSWPLEPLILLLFSSLTLLYSRLKGDELLNNYRRGLIHGYILANPGVSFSELRNALDIPNGPLVYHLSVLEKNRMIKHRRLGNLVEYVGSEFSYRDLSSLKLTVLQQSIVRHAMELGQVSKSDLRKLVNCSHQTLHYNLNKLVSMEVLERKLVRGRWHFTVAPQVAPCQLTEIQRNRVPETVTEDAF